MSDKKPNTGSEIAPHVCDCGSACYRGFNEIKCVNMLCQWHDRETLDQFCKEHLVAVRDEGDDLFCDEDTLPGAGVPPLAGKPEPYLIGNSLAVWAKVLDVDQVAGETDEQLRARLLAKIGRTPGTIVDFDDDDMLPDSYMVPVVKGFD